MMPPVHPLLSLDAAAAVGDIARTVQRQVRAELCRDGVVVGLSGGIDSTVVAALCVRALGADRVAGLLMPERECSPDTPGLSRRVAEWLGVRAVHEDITPILEAAGCYRRRDEAVRAVVPGYGPGWRVKVVVAGTLDDAGSDAFRLVVEPPQGGARFVEPEAGTLHDVIAATSFKQRVRKMMEYHLADRLHYAVAGTPNRLEYELGFFVKNGDGAADIKPIAHLYKSQVYQLGEFLGAPREVLARTPSTDTYPLAQTQEEFYFGLPLATLDLCLFCRNTRRPAEETAALTGLTVRQVRGVFGDMAAKRALAEYLHAAPLKAGEV